MKLSFEEIELLSPDLKWGKNIKSLGAHQPSSGLTSWLQEKQLLTERIHQLHREHSIEVLNEYHGPVPGLLKNLQTEQNNFIREILLSIDKQVCVLAQTVVPRETLEKNSWIKTLGTQPLGERLLKKPNVSRSEFEYSFLKHSMSSFWLRRSSFNIDKTMLWVIELFLPVIERYTDD
jgi:chorismate-pyruvate lyase